MNQSSLTVCPVPHDQRPLNEYEELKESWFFKWARLDLVAYLKGLLWVWLAAWLVSAPVASYSFSPAHLPLQFWLMSATGAALFPALTLARLYLGWNYIRSRLLNATIFYEESGWYDGQYWTKTAEELTKDRLVATYQVEPVLRRLRGSLAVLGGLLSLGILLWNFV